MRARQRRTRMEQDHHFLIVDLDEVVHCLLDFQKVDRYEGKKRMLDLLVDDSA